MCPNCGHLEAYSEEKQLRSADEGSTILYTVSPAGFSASKKQTNSFRSASSANTDGGSTTSPVSRTYNWATRLRARRVRDQKAQGLQVTRGNFGGMESYYADECRDPDGISWSETGGDGFTRIPRQYRTWLPFRNRQARSREGLPSIP